VKICFSWRRYRHDFLDNGFGIEWFDENDESTRKTITEESIHEQDSIEHSSSKRSRSVITVQSINHNATRLPAHIWRSLAKVETRISVPLNIVFE